MPKQKRKPRLKKNPEIADYVVEMTRYEGGGMRQEFQYFTLRAKAREFAKTTGADRTRVFHLKATLVSDSRGRK